MAASELRSWTLRGYEHLVSFVAAAVLYLVFLRCSNESREVLAEYWKTVLRLVRQIWGSLVYLS